MTTDQTTSVPISHPDTDGEPNSVVSIVGRNGGESNAPPVYQNGSNPQTDQQISTQPIQPMIEQPLLIPAKNGSNNEKEPLQLLQPHQQTNQFLPAVQPGTINTAITANHAISNDAVRMSFVQYVTISNLKTSSNNLVPNELSSRGITQDEFNSIITRVKRIKSKSDINKVTLWTGMIFMCGLIGLVLVTQRAVGNTKLRKKLESPLEDVNRTLINRAIPVRFLWVDGNLRAYYK